MTIPETVGVIVGIPAAIYVAIAGLTMTMSKGRPKTAEYRLGEQWTRGPLLWTAVDEVVAGGGHHGHSGHHGSPAELIGGRASGRF